MGSSKSKDCYDSSNISLASRIVKVEAQMENVDLKITQFLNNYSMDMQILMSKVDQQKNSTNNNNSRNKQFREEIPTKMSYNLNKMDYFVHNHVDLEGSSLKLISNCLFLCLYEFKSGFSCLIINRNFPTRKLDVVEQRL